MDWLDLFAVQGTLKSHLQYHSSKASILQYSAFFTVQLSQPYMTTGKTIALTRRTFVGKVISMLFPVVMYGCESWTIKKAARQRIDAFELWYWRWLLRIPWTARRSNQSILKEISPEYSLEGLVLKLKLWPLYVKNWLIWKDPNAGQHWRQEEKGTTEDDGWKASPPWWTWVWASCQSWWWTGRPGMLRFMGLQRVGHDWVTEFNWTEVTSVVSDSL